MIKRTTFSYVYYLTRVFFIGFGFSFLFSIANNGAWLSFLLGHIISLFIMFLVVKIKEKYKVNAFLKNKGHYLLKALIIAFSASVAIEILFIFQTLASNFFLVDSPHYFIILPALLLVFRICKNGWTTIGRVGSILMYLSLLMVIIAFFGLFSYAESENFLPIFTTSSFNILKATIFYVAYSSAPIIFLILIPDTNEKIPQYYFLANLTIIIMGILIIGILGPDLITIYRYPEYMVLKVIKLLNFIEKVENIFAIATLIDLFMVLAISMNAVKEKLPKKRTNIIFFSILIGIYFTSLYLGRHYNLALQIYYYLPIILLIFMILILTLLSIAIKKTKQMSEK